MNLLLRLWICLVVKTIAVADDPTLDKNCRSSRNIIFILCDDQRYDAAGFEGHPFLKTPNMERLAPNGVWDLDELYDLKNDPEELHNLIFDPAHQDLVTSLNRRLFDVLGESGGMNLPILPDRGTQFHHRRPDGSRVAEFPPEFYLPWER